MTPRLIAIAALAATIVVLIALFASVDSGWIVDPKKWSSVVYMEGLESSVPSQRSAVPSDGRHVYYILLLATAVLVLLDTLAYTKAIHAAGERASAKSQERTPENMRSAAMIIMFPTTILIAFWAVEIPFNIVGGILGESQPYLHEFVAIMIFTCFSVVDLLLWLSYRRESRSEANDAAARKEFKAHDREYLGQLLFVDLPVVVGLAFVVILSLVYLGEVRSSFGNGFRAGAVIAHLAFSQFVFLALVLHGRLVTSTDIGDRDDRDEHAEISTVEEVNGAEPGFATAQRVDASL